MSTSEIIAIIVSTVGGSTAVLVAVAWIVKSIINHALSKNIEEFKLKLQNQSQQEILRLQSSLQLHEFEHQVRFSQLHERLAAATIEVYDRLRCLYSEVRDTVAFITTDSRPPGAKAQALQDAATAFADYYYRHKILFPKELANSIDEFRSLLRDVIRKDRQSDHAGQANPEDSHWEELRKEVDKLVEEKLPSVFDSLESHFRIILGSLSLDRNLKDEPSPSVT
jgi:hypothetical protein